MGTRTLGEGGRRWRLSRCWVSALLVLGTLAATAVSNPRPADAAGEPGGFYDGPIEYSSIVNCASIIFPPAYKESGAAAYVGQYADPDENPPVPATNQAFYVHVVVYGLGNACSGQRFIPAFSLPSNVSLYTAAPILCFTANGQATSASDCPQWGNVTTSTIGGQYMYLSTDGANANSWPLPQGAFWEFRIPVVSSTTKTNATLRGFVKMFDGNDSPVLTPDAPFYVFAGGGGGGASFMYDSPSTTARALSPLSVRPSFGIVSEGVVVTGGVAGSLRLQRGTTSGSFTESVSIPVDSSGTAWSLWTDWDDPAFAPVKANQKYFWRLGFDPGAAGGGDVTWGAQQSFVGLWAQRCDAAPVTVALGLGQLPTASDDVILGTPKADTISAGDGSDTVCAGAGGDRVDGGAMADFVDAGGGGDLVLAGAGDDVLRGAAGTDTVSYADASGGVVVSLAASGTQGTGGGGFDTLSGFENLGGGDGPDVLTGTGGANRLSGGKGADALKAGAGTDRCDGGAGTDTGTGCETKISIP